VLYSSRTFALGAVQDQGPLLGLPLNGEALVLVMNMLNLPELVFLEVRFGD
jgi:hypothetical protein